MHKTPPNLTLTGEIWVSFVNICVKIDGVIMTPHCISDSIQHVYSVISGLTTSFQFLLSLLSHPQVPSHG